MHEICGVALKPDFLRSKTVSKVFSLVEPPAPKVTEKNSGLYSLSFLAVCISLVTPS